MIEAAKKVQLKRTRKDLRLVGERDKSFYQISSQENLAVIGATYLEEFESGITSFGFSSSCYKTTQQRMALAVASYFEHLYEMRILILTASGKRGLFKDFLLKGESRIEGGVEKIGFYHHFDFITLEDTRADQIVNYVKDQNDYDLLIWDLPLLSDAPMGFSTKYLSGISSLTVIAPPSNRSKDNVEVKKHFDSYGIDLSGMKIRQLGGSEA